MTYVVLNNQAVYRSLIMNQTHTETEDKTRAITHMHTEADMEDFTVQEVSEKKNNR